MGVDRVPSCRGMGVTIGAWAPHGKVPGLLFHLLSCGHEEYVRNGMDSCPTT